MSLDQLQEALSRGPAIVSVKTPVTVGAHALILEGIEDGMALIRDPLPEGTGSAYRVALETFLDSWKGKAVTR